MMLLTDLQTAHVLSNYGAISAETHFMHVAILFIGRPNGLQLSTLRLLLPYIPRYHMSVMFEGFNGLLIGAP